MIFVRLQREFLFGGVILRSAQKMEMIFVHNAELTFVCFRCIFVIGRKLNFFHKMKGGSNMSQNKRRQSISLLLIFCLLLSCLPGGAIAQTTEAEPQASAAPTTAVTPADTFQLDADCQILRYVDESVFTAGNHVARLTEQETLDTYVFLNADGTQTVYYMDENVKYLDENGVVREKDITLSATRSGFATASNSVGLSLPTNLAQGITISYGGYDVNLIPENIAAATAVQQDGKIAYLNCYGKGTGLIYTPTLSGVKEDILLSAYTGVNSFSFLLNTDGLRLYTNEQGRYYFAKSANAEFKVELADIVAYDANGQHSLGSITVTPITMGQQYRLTVTIDENFLTAETTVYPVLIDPTITVSDTLTGANAIEDATIYQGKPSVNYGILTENYAGYYNSEFGVGRTVVRLTGLLSDDTYQSVSAYQIQAATFYLKESSNTAPVQVNLFPLNSNSTWTESNVTWNNVGTFDSILQYFQEMGYNSTGSFDITSLVRAWKNGNYSNGQCGFLIALHDELDAEKSFYSSEYSTTSRRPYVAVTYSSTNHYVNVDEDDTVTLSTEGLSGTITWASSNTSFATVSNGVVTGVKAGQVTVTATINGEVVRRYTVYVTLPDGAYFIKLQNYERYLTPSTISYASDTPLNMSSQALNHIYRLSQIWNIRYLSNGYYTITTIYKDDLRLVGNDGYSPVLSTSTVGNEHKWTIQYNQTGYVLQTAAYTDCTLTGSGTAGSLASLSDYDSSNANQRWIIDPTTPEGMLLLDSETGERMDISINELGATMLNGETKTLTQLGLTLKVFDPLNDNQSYTISFTSPEYASFNSANNSIQGIKRGGNTATLTRVINGTSYNIRFYLHVCVQKNVVVQYDQGYVDRYGGSSVNNLLALQMEALKNKYIIDFNMIINYSAPTQFSSYADTCDQPYDENCTHLCSGVDCQHQLTPDGSTCIESVCNESGPDDFYEIALHEYHHKNINNTAYRIQKNSDATYLAFVGHNICSHGTDGLGYPTHDENTETATSLYGMYYNLIDVVVLVDHTDTDITDPEHAIFTLIHEFGHSEDAPDHYGGQYPTADILNRQVDKDPFNEDCMYGKNWRNHISDLKICDGCRQVINGTLELP